MDAQARAAYIELLKQSLTRYLVIDERPRSGRGRPVLALIMTWLAGRSLTLASVAPSLDGRSYRYVQRALARFGLRVYVVPDPGRPMGHGFAGSSARNPSRRKRIARIQREFGLDWPEDAETMVGLRRLDNVEHGVTAAIRDGVPGDLVEAGVWRGGTAISCARCALPTRSLTGGFGWPTPSGACPTPARALILPTRVLISPASRNSPWVFSRRRETSRSTACSTTVSGSCPGFKETLYEAGIERLAILRVDADLYESTIDAIESLYRKLAVGGYCIVDDYGALEACRRAVHDFRARYGVREPMQAADWCGASGSASISAAGK